MSSGDEEYNRSGTGEDPKALKKRRIQRACDTCRRKKIRCDGATTAGNKCSNCAAYNYDCTYVEAAKKRGPPKGYVESLESRLQKMETLLQRLCPNADFTKELGVHMDRETWYNERQKRGGTSPVAAVPRKLQPSPPGSASLASQNIHAYNSVSDEFGLSDDDPAQLPDEIQRLTVTSKDRRFHGKSSGFVLVQTAIDMKREYTGGDSMNTDPKRPDFWSHSEWEGKRARTSDDQLTFDFPPSDLIDALIPLFFFHNNLYLPILHRPTFERQYHERLHETDTGFASVLLLVCAIASRCSKDPRVLRPDTFDGDTPPSRHSAGWKYFDQVKMQRKSLTSPATLFDLQQYALAGIFLQGSAAPYASWVTVGIGLRVAQDVGAHRKRLSDSSATVESELWKRAFWVLVNLDRLGSAALGRPCAIHDEDFDLDPPLEVDDEYWETPNPEDAFKQPPDRPSTVAYFNALIRLDQILSFGLRTIYSINKSKILLGFAGEKDWAQNTVVELDTSLNQWLETVPEHLRWDLRWNPSKEFSVFFQQSAILYATYYHIQILVHRPFIPRPGKPAPLTFPSLAICTNAARSCSQVLQAYRRKCDAGSAPQLMFYAFTSGLVLLLNIWGMRKQGQGFAGDTDAPMHDVHMCMQFLKAAENRWHLAGRLWDILCELASAGDFPLPHPSPVAGSKRERDSDSPKSAATPEYAMNLDGVSGSSHPVSRPTSFISSRRQSAQPQVPPMQPTDFGQMLEPMPLLPNPNFMQHQHLHHQHPHPRPHPHQHPHQHPHPHQSPGTGAGTSGSEHGIAGVQEVPWFAAQSDLSGDVNHTGSTTFGSSATTQPVLQQLFSTGAAGPSQQVYPPPSSAQPYGSTGHFPGQDAQNAFASGVNGIPSGVQNPTWGDTLNMWSTAPTGFVWEDWNDFTSNMVPGSRPDEQQPPS